MKKQVVVSVLLTLVVLGVATAYTQNFRKLRALLTGQQEVPVVVTDGRGSFRAVISKDGTEINYELSYSEMGSDVTQAHIHLGQRNVNGGIVVWLCGNPNPPQINPPPGTQTCPLRSGTITGTITGANIVGPPSQGVTSGEIEELINAIRDGNTYVNVHSLVSPGGEIRSQIGIRKGSGGDDDDEGHH